MHRDNMTGGSLEVELTSAEIEYVLAQINAAGIILTTISYDGELSCCFCVKGADYPAVRELCRKRGDSLRVVKKRGVYWHIQN